MPSPAVIAHRLPKSARVRTRADYACAFEGAKRLHTPLLQLAVKLDASTGAGARLGIAVSRKVDGNAVGRNRIKRVWREAFRLQQSHLPAGTYVAIAKPAAAQADNPTVRDALLDLLSRVARSPGRLPGSPAIGTMPPDTSSPDPSLTDASPPASISG